MVLLHNFAVVALKGVFAQVNTVSSLVYLSFFFLVFKRGKL